MRLAKREFMGFAWDTYFDAGFGLAEFSGGSMYQGVVLLGDKTNHGGEVISASSTIMVRGKAVALVGDEVSCPRPGHGNNAIVEGSDHWFESGRAVVVDGCRSECGCRVISSAFDCGVG